MFRRRHTKQRRNRNKMDIHSQDGRKVQDTYRGTNVSRQVETQSKRILFSSLQRRSTNLTQHGERILLGRAHGRHQNSLRTEQDMSIPISQEVSTSPLAELEDRTSGNYKEQNMT